LQFHLRDFSRTGMGDTPDGHQSAVVCVDDRHINRYSVDDRRGLHSRIFIPAPIYPKTDTPVYEYGPNTWGTSEVDQKVSHTEQNPVVTD
jgi:hypothetical protein